ncbi:hypothetical protein K504DRAFT_468868 [Pleomassaria siparia CBS 279.74]|uniref:Extracellular membrane protein CFEM domain-containing protein n=1 Tax=Pleomassaria siparia CBS 279.74 TaxID=1314801 RepID=A0A6G1JQ07_9PLEO|nr:hypothetical protein K504DRAFT_468868 [Pleomassaria siparia CBS 279.74]
MLLLCHLFLSLSLSCGVASTTVQTYPSSHVRHKAAAHVSPLYKTAHARPRCCNRLQTSNADNCILRRACDCMLNHDSALCTTTTTTLLALAIHVTHLYYSVVAQFLILLLSTTVVSSSAGVASMAFCCLDRRFPFSSTAPLGPAIRLHLSDVVWRLHRELA